MTKNFQVTSLSYSKHFMHNITYKSCNRRRLVNWNLLSLCWSHRPSIDKISLLFIAFQGGFVIFVFVLAVRMDACKLETRTKIKIFVFVLCFVMSLRPSVRLSRLRSAGSTERTNDKNVGSVPCTGYSVRLQLIFRRPRIPSHHFHLSVFLSVCHA